MDTQAPIETEPDYTLRADPSSAAFTLRDHTGTLVGALSFRTLQEHIQEPYRMLCRPSDEQDIASSLRRMIVRLARVAGWKEPTAEDGRPLPAQLDELEAIIHRKLVPQDPDVTHVE